MKNRGYVFNEKQISFVKSFMKRHGYSQADLNDIMGMSRGYISNVLHGKPISFDRFAKLTEVLGCDRDWFFELGKNGGERTREPKPSSHSKLNPISFTVDDHNIYNTLVTMSQNMGMDLGDFCKAIVVDYIGQKTHSMFEAKAYKAMKEVMEK